MFGTHLTIDGSGCKNLDNLQIVWEVLDKLPNIIGMTKITQPYMFPYSGLVPEDKGITGIVIIAESHISIHTFTEKNYMFCDIFSCKKFDTKLAVEYLRSIFDIKTVTINIIERGLDFPR